MAEDVDVALKLLTQRRREACEAKAMCAFYEKGSEMVGCIYIYIEVFIDVLQYIDVCVSSFVYWIYRHQGFYILETFEKTILCASLMMSYFPCFWCEICVLYSQGSIFYFDLSLRK